MNAEQAWQSVLGQLQTEMPKASFDTWVRDTHVITANEQKLTLGVRNAYARDWLESRLGSTVNRLLVNFLGKSMEVEFVISGNSDGMDAYEDISDSNAPATASYLQSRHPALNPRYTFNNFVVGSNNRLAHAAALAVAENPARAYNPLFLYGGVGLGKTHLLQAIGNACHERGLMVLYVSSEEFTNDMINAIRSHTTQAFRDKYRSIDVMLIDDIQFIAGKESTQEEFFHTFNTLHGQDKQIIVSSDRSPKALVTLEERLRSRFEWGLTADIQAPDVEMRLAILRSKAERSWRTVPDEVLQTIAGRIQSNIRELEGALNRIVAYADLSGATLTKELTETVLTDLLPQRKDIPPQTIIEAIARKYQISVEEMLGRDRSQKVALPRQIAMYFLREETNASLPQIGEILGGRDHTTVMYALDKIKEEIKNDTNSKLLRDIKDIRQLLYGQSLAA